MLRYLKAREVFDRLSVSLVGFIQAVGILLYCGAVALLFWKGNQWFGKINGYLGPVLFLSLLVVSVLVCGLFAFGYPILLFWDKKKSKKALKIVMFTSIWLLVFVFLVVLSFLIF